MRFLKFIIIQVLFIVSEYSYAQQLEWQISLDSGESYEYIEDFVFTSSSHLICIGYSRPGNGSEPRIFKADTNGNFLWFKNIIGDTLKKGYYNFILKVPEEPDNFYVGAYASESLPVARNTDILIKMDTAGDTLWTRKFSYPTFYSTMRDALVLKDKSIITTGEILDATGFNFIVRRIDSTGNTLWENVYTLPEEQLGYNVIEMMDGSIVISGIHSNRKYCFLKIRFDGTYLDYSVVPSIRNSQFLMQDLALLPNNHIAMSAFSIAGLDEIGHYVELDQFLDTVKNLETGNATFLGPLVLMNNNLFFNGIDFSDNLSFNILNPIIFTTVWDTLYSNLSSGDVFQANGHEFKGSDLFLAGIGGNSIDFDYRIAKINNIGPQWIPDRCAYQPPVAGFEWDYNYPVLTLRDTSSGGLKYLDTVYTWQWNTSIGSSGTDDSLMVFFDTAISKTLDVQLIISNWYECMDTLNVTLNFDPTGISAIKEWDVKVYPNPVTDVLQIELSESSKNKVLFEIFDLRGNKLISDEFTGTHLSSKVHGLPSGMYFYSISEGAQIRRGKLIKQ